MGKLRNLSPLLSSPAPRLTRLTVIEREEKQSLYHSVAWRQLRWEVLTRDRFTCRRCNTLFVDTSRLVADHIVPHRGDEKLFWDKSNLQTLCDTCHNRAKQAEERAAFGPR